ncbi:hypothetical protein [Amycolatopsis sp. NPDC051716]|jgi:hypothetical protein|uniref:hypothetical protein n=1 Tax=Amycolatopsis sp. NPDC051716 TaxID=3155804 RepID=UPI00343E4E96
MGKSVSIAFTGFSAGCPEHLELCGHEGARLPARADGGERVVVVRRKNRWRGFGVQLLVLAIWSVAYRYLIRPLLPSGDVLGIVILVVLALGILAVPIVSAWNRRKR